MTELSFLIKLFLIPDIPCTVRDLLVDRIREVEEKLTASTHISYEPIRTQNGVPIQAPSTLAAMARHGDIVAVPIMPPIPEQPVTQVAQTPMAVAALNTRNQAINESLAGKIDKATGRPKKFLNI